MKLSGFDQKANKFFSVYFYPHLTLSSLDKMIGKSLLQNLNFLDAQKVTLENAGEPSHA